MPVYDFNLASFQNIILPALQKVKELESEGTEANESIPLTSLALGAGLKHTMIAATLIPF